MASPVPMKSIKREELYTNLEARIQYLHSFLDFSSNDIEALISGAKYIKALVPAVVNIVYRKLLQYDITARAFTTKNTTQAGDVGEVLSEDSPQIVHRKMFLRAYLNKLCSDPSRMEFWEYLDKVGMMHVGLGRKHPLHIEYVHLGACLGFIQDIMTEAILSHPRLHMYRKIALVKALNKVIWIQNDFMAKWHVREADEFGLLESDVVIEKEGYLHGKKILDDKVMPDASAGLPVLGHSDELRKSQCPFSSGLPIPSPLRSSIGIEASSEDATSVSIPESPRVELESQ
ncbi:Globin [Metarhizium rileyi]|uniref:Globin n=1 Tax=Metarhizium rileyi (strain RCEF 4871) TaxID=1649241 RepID=A0A166X852_METRR|nr:Globin [Metarhizium rileyi RCEF 4871]